MLTCGRFKNADPALFQTGIECPHKLQLYFIRGIGMMKVIFYWSLHSSYKHTTSLNVVPNNNLGAEAQHEKVNFSQCGSSAPHEIHSANIRPTCVLNKATYDMIAIWNMETRLLARASEVPDDKGVLFVNSVAWVSTSQSSLNTQAMPRNFSIAKL